MRQVVIQSISGASYPVDVYISDVNFNYLTKIGTINSGPVPPNVIYNESIPPIFNTAPEILIMLVDNNNCQVIKKIPCSPILDILVYQNNIYFRLQNDDLLLIQV